MEDLSPWSMDCLINLWVDMSTPDFDVLPATQEYGNKRLQIGYLIQEKLVFVTKTQWLF